MPEKTLFSPLQPIVDSTAAIVGVHCSVQWNPRQCLVESTARSECLRYLIVESNALQRISLRRNRQKSEIDCNVTAFVSGLRCTLSKTAVQRNALQKFKIPTFGSVMEILEKYNLFFTFPNACAIQTKHGTNKLLNKTCQRIWASCKTSQGWKKGMVF